jgi:glycosyltransferase involved in cell wall biosynthesis
MRFSIILPLRNQKHLVLETIASVLNQTFTNYELLLIDPGSLLKADLEGEIFFDDPKISYHPIVSSTFTAACNYGAKIANGKYYIFLNSHDLVDPNWLHDFDASLQSKDSDLLFCGVEQETEDGKRKQMKRNIQKDYFFEKMVPGSFCISKKLFYQAAGYDVFMEVYVHTEFFYRIATFYPTRGMVAKNHLIHRNYLKEVIISDKVILKSVLYLIEKHQKTLEKRKGTRKRFFAIAGKAAIRTENYRLARKIFFKSLSHDPLDPKSFFRLMISFNKKAARRIWHS